MKIRHLLLPLLMLALLSVPAFPQDALTGERVKAVAAEASVGRAHVGVRIETADGTVIADVDGEKLFVPASNAKLITTGTALTALGGGFRFETALAYSGTVADGVLTGDLYIVGGGDPTLFSGDSIARSRESVFALWGKMLSDAGIRSVKGRIVGDGRHFDGQPEEPSWLYEDIGTYYGTGGDALCWNRNIVDFSVRPGAEPGAPLKILRRSPETPWMTYVYDCATGAPGTGDRLYLYTSEYSGTAVLRGTLGSDVKSKNVLCSNKFGSYTCAWMFREYLTGAGVSVSGDAACTDRRGMLRTVPWQSGGEKAAAVSGLKVIGTMDSPELRRIIGITNRRSDNFYAEALFREMGKRLKGSAAYSASAEAELSALKNMGLKTSGAFSPVDGSGLSRKNLVSPAFMCGFLRTVLHSAGGGDFLASLPHPPAAYLKAVPASRVYYKSGSMDGVRCWSGFIVPGDGGEAGTLVFSIMVNNYSGSSREVLSAIGRMLDMAAAE